MDFLWPTSTWEGKAKLSEFAGSSPPPQPPSDSYISCTGEYGGAEWTKITTWARFSLFSRKISFALGSLNPWIFPGKGKSKCWKFEGRRPRGGRRDKNIQNIENTQDIHKVYSTSETFQIFDVLNIDISNFVFTCQAFHCEHFSWNRPNYSPGFRRRWSIYHFAEHTNKMKWITFSITQSSIQLEQLMTSQMKWI